MNIQIGSRIPSVISALMLLLSFPLWSADNTAWEVQERWTPAFEKEYSDFIVALGTSKAQMVEDFFFSPGNPYYAKTPKELKGHLFSDCADLPYVLRAYFAFIHKLPFSYTMDVEANGDARDIRYSPDGNYPAHYKSISSSKDKNFIHFLQNLRKDVSTAQFRMPPDLDVKTAGPSSNAPIIPDFYSPAINRQSIIPGTNVYDPNGHVAIVYKVDDDGTIHMVDAHPDNSLTRIIYGKKFVRSRPEAGAGFKNWRPLDSEGRPLANSAIPQYSLVQYYGTEGEKRTEGEKKPWNKGRFMIKNESRDYYDYMREAMARGELQYDPEKEFALMLNGINTDIQSRSQQVNLALVDKIDEKSHINKLPLNIYGAADEEWEKYSSPSRDARLKTGFKEARDRVLKFLEMAKTNDHPKDPHLKFNGTRDELFSKLKAVYQKHVSETAFVFKHPLGTSKDIHLTFSQFEDRLFKISFDPYHSFELRWGESGTHDSKEKKDWYDAEQRMRNQIDRPYDAVMGFTLKELQTTAANNNNNGIAHAPACLLKDIFVTGLK